MSIHKLVSMCVCERDFKAAEKTNSHTFTEERGEYKQEEEEEEEEGPSSGLIIAYFTDEGQTAGEDSLFILICFSCKFFFTFPCARKNSFSQSGISLIQRL